MHVSDVAFNQYEDFQQRSKGIYGLKNLPRLLGLPQLTLALFSSSNAYAYTVGILGDVH